MLMCKNIKLYILAGRRQSSVVFPFSFPFQDWWIHFLCLQRKIIIFRRIFKNSIARGLLHLSTGLYFGRFLKEKKTLYNFSLKRLLEDAHVEYLLDSVFWVLSKLVRRRVWWHRLRIKFQSKKLFFETYKLGMGFEFLKHIY